MRMVHTVRSSLSEPSSSDSIHLMSVTSGTLLVACFSPVLFHVLFEIQQRRRQVLLRLSCQTGIECTYKSALSVCILIYIYW